MKLAIVLIGQPRSVKIGYESLKNFYLDKYECDIFSHTWFDKQFPLSLYGEIINLYKPKKFLVEEQIIFDKLDRRDPIWKTPLQNILSMYYSMYMANQLRNLYEETTGVVYDFVMRMRTDLKISKPIELEKIEKGKLAIYEWTETVYDKVGVSDVFAIGTPDIMNIYSDLYSKIMYYIDQDQTYIIDDSKMRAEYILKHHLETVNKIPIQKFYHKDHTNPSFSIIR